MSPFEGPSAVGPDPEGATDHDADPQQGGTSPVPSPRTMTPRRKRVRPRLLSSATHRIPRQGRPSLAVYKGSRHSQLASARAAAFNQGRRQMPPPAASPRAPTLRAVAVNMRGMRELTAALVAARDNGHQELSSNDAAEAAAAAAAEETVKESRRRKRPPDAAPAATDRVERTKNSCRQSSPHGMMEKAAMTNKLGGTGTSRQGILQAASTAKGGSHSKRPQGAGSLEKSPPRRRRSKGTVSPDRGEMVASTPVAGSRPKRHVMAVVRDVYSSAKESGGAITCNGVCCFSLFWC
jgi:hypothetical protein